MTVWPGLHPGHTSFFEFDLWVILNKCMQGGKEIRWTVREVRDGARVQVNIFVQSGEVTEDRPYRISFTPFYGHGVEE
jgi:hypothetical protein